MAYSDFQPTKPDVDDDGTQIPVDARRNDRALRDAILACAFPGFEFSIVNGTGDARRPQYMYWKQGSGGSAPWVRATLTWSAAGTNKYCITGVQWEYSANGGSSYDNMASAAALTYDSNGNLTAVSNMAAANAITLALLGHFWRHVDDYATHVADTTAHDVGTLAAQDASAVAITGGTIETTLQRVLIPAGALLGTKNAPFNIDLNNGHFFSFTVQSGAVATFTNKPSSGTFHPFTLEIVNGGLVADQTLFPGCKAANGLLTLQTSGTDLVHGYVRDGATVIFTGTTPALLTLS